LIDVDDRAVIVNGDGTQHLEAQAAFVDGVGRSGDIQQNASSLLDNFGDGVAIVAAIGPEIFVVPYVFADGDAQLFLAQAVDVLLFGGLEVTAFVENIVGRQEHFALLEDHAAAVDERGFISNSFPVAVFDATSVPHDGGQRQLGGQFFQFL
jgi:hypothetical protein